LTKTDLVIHKVINKMCKVVDNYYTYTREIHVFVQQDKKY